MSPTQCPTPWNSKPFFPAVSEGEGAFVLDFLVSCSGGRRNRGRRHHRLYAPEVIVPPRSRHMFRTISGGRIAVP